MGVQKLYEPSSTPILYVGLAADVLGRVPLIPLFLLPPLGGLSVAETEELRIAVAKDGAKRAVATRARRRRKALKAAGPPAGLE